MPGMTSTSISPPGREFEDADVGHVEHPLSFFQRHLTVECDFPDPVDELGVTRLLQHKFSLVDPPGCAGSPTANKKTPCVRRP